MNLPKHANLWLPAYLRERTRRLASRTPPPRRLWVALADHYEPMGGAVSLQVGRARVQAWQQRWPTIAAAAPCDAAGNPPCFTFFYPQEEYEPSILDAISTIVRTGTADVEVHIHHDHDTADTVREKLDAFTTTLRQQHGLLHTHNGRPVFGFIHGNWALDNSRPDGRWCGVTGELQVLRSLGCYADFTMPSVPSPTQSRVVNRIYWTAGAPNRPRGFDQAIDAEVGDGDRSGLLMIPGPLGLRFRDRLLPRVETGELAWYDPPTPARVERWLDLAPRLGDDLFVKLYGHSAREDNAAALLGTRDGEGTLAPMFRSIAEAATRRNLELHWVSAFGMFQAVDNLLHQPTASIQGAA